MRRSYLLLCLVTAGWGTIPVLVGQVNLPSPLIVAIRLWTATACLGGAVWLSGRRGHRAGRAAPAAGPGPAGQVCDPVQAGPVSRGAPPWPRLLSVQPGRCVLAAAVLAAHWLALFAAYRRAPAGTVILIVYLAPIGVAALAPRLLGERLGWRTLAALVGASAGFGLLAMPAVRAAGGAGLLLSAAAALLFVALIVLSKPLASEYGGLRLAFLEMGGAGAALIPVALASSWPAPEPSWVWLLVLGAVHTALGVAIYLHVLAELPATHVGILGYLEPTSVILFAWLWLGQRPAAATVLGGLLVIGAGVSTVLGGTGRRPPGAQVGGLPWPLGAQYRRGDERAPHRVGGSIGKQQPARRS